MKLEQVLVPIVFFVALCLTGVPISTFFLRSLGIHLSPLTRGLQWCSVIVAIILFSSLIIVSTYHLGMLGYIAAGAVVVCLSAFSGAFVYLRYRNQ